MLIKVQHPELYREWLRWYEMYEPDSPPYEQRTEAFIASNEGKQPFWGRYS